jgi:hypothetical protein
LVENPINAPLTDATAVERVIRRQEGNGVGVEAELYYPEVVTPAEAEALMVEFHELATLAETTEPELVFDVLSSRFDFDNYLRWIALNSLLLNGDYIDETFFWGSFELTGDGGEVLYFRNLGWDYESMNTACHFGGAYAVVDPYGIAYCAEDQVDRTLLLSDAVYERFIEHLDGMITDTITEEILAAELDRIQEELFAVLDDDDACAAMVELTSPPPATWTCPDVQFEISRRIDVFQLAMSSRYFVLGDLIETWRTSH